MKRKIFFLFIILFVGRLRQNIHAQTPQEEMGPKPEYISAVIIYNHSGLNEVPVELHSEIEKTVYIMDAVLWNEGIQVQVPYIKGDDEALDPTNMKEVCEEKGVRLAVTVWTNYADDTLSWRFGVFDPEENRVRASESFFTPLLVTGGGLSIADTVEYSAHRLIQKYDKSFPVVDFSGDFAVNIPQKFLSTHEGIEIRYGGEDGALAGTIVNGELTAPLFLFVQDQPVFGTASKKGYWSRRFVLPKGITPEPFTVKPLLARNRQSIVFMTELRDLDIYSTNFDYRLFIIPDRWFLRLGYAVWMDKTDLSIKKKKAHNEFRGGMGISLLPKTEFPLRFIIGSGASIVIAGNNMDILTDPLWVALEYHFSRFALVSEFRLEEFFGYDRTVFAKDRSDFGPCLSFGVMIKW